MRLAKLSLLINTLLSFLIFPSSVLAQAEPVKEECDDAGDKCYAPLPELETIFANIISVITVLAGFAILIVLIIGGFRYIIARGDPKAVGAARSQIMWGFIGLFFIIAAWLILLFISQFTELNLTNFCIGLDCNP
jgi:hypothetical protein